MYFGPILLSLYRRRKSRKVHDTRYSHAAPQQYEISSGVSSQISYLAEPTGAVRPVVIYTADNRRMEPPAPTFRLNIYPDTKSGDSDGYWYSRWVVSEPKHQGLSCPPPRGCPGIRTRDIHKRNVFPLTSSSSNCHNLPVNQFIRSLNRHGLQVNQHHTSDKKT